LTPGTRRHIGDPHIRRFQEIQQLFFSTHLQNLVAGQVGILLANPGCSAAPVEGLPAQHMLPTTPRHLGTTPLGCRPFNTDFRGPLTVTGN
jgi:hypothetical protein